MNYNVLIADDESEIIDVIKLYLERDGYKVIECNDGKKAWDSIQQGDIHIAVLDIMMPEINGFELLKMIRTKYCLPVIILSARSLDNDKILGLGLGADDYLAKPFNPLELAARINAQLRRHYELSRYIQESNIKKIINLGDIEINPETCTVLLKGRAICLTSTEYKILLCLMQNKGRVFTKKQLFESIRGDYFENDDNAIMVHISNLREKIETDSKKPIYIKTIRGLGYKFEKNI